MFMAEGVLLPYLGLVSLTKEDELEKPGLDQRYRLSEDSIRLCRDHSHYSRKVAFDESRAVVQMDHDGGLVMLSVITCK